MTRKRTLPGGLLVALLLAGVPGLVGCSAAADDPFPSLSVRRATSANASVVRTSVPVTPTSTSTQETAVKITLIVAGQQVVATLDDTRAARELAAQLPQELTFTDFNSAEKIATPKQTLSIEGLPTGWKPSIGSLAYYAPWGNLVVFYRDAPVAGGLYPLGTLDDVRPFAAQSGDFIVSAR